MKHKFFKNTKICRKNSNASTSCISDPLSVAEIPLIEGNIHYNWSLLPSLRDSLNPVSYPEINIVLPSGHWLVYFTTTHTSDHPISTSRAKSAFIRWDLVDNITLNTIDYDYSMACFGMSSIDTVCIFQVENESAFERTYSLLGKTTSCNCGLYFSLKPRIWASNYMD